MAWFRNNRKTAKSNWKQNIQSGFIIDLRPKVSEDSTSSFKTKKRYKQPKFRLFFQNLFSPVNKLQRKNKLQRINTKRNKLIKKNKRQAQRRILFIANKRRERFLAKQRSLFTKNKKPKIRFSRRRDLNNKSPLIKTWYFALILLILILPLKLLSYFNVLDIKNLEKNLSQQSLVALEQIFLGFKSVSALDFNQANNNFSQASQNFLVAQDDLKIINNSLLYLASLSKNPKLKIASESKNFLAIGVDLADLGKNLSLASESLFVLQDKDLSEAALIDFVHYSDLALVDIHNLVNNLDKIKLKNIPVEFQTEFTELIKQVKILENSLANISTLAHKLKDILGFEQDKRYLLIFQNNSELRASGGFLGSYALVDLKQGKIKNLEVPAGGSYDTEGGMTTQVKAPEPLWLVNPAWHFWDANWWPDFPTTAKNLMWFYEKSGGPTVDGVISLTPNVLEDLLRITGPINLEKEYDLVIDADNFWDLTQKVVEHRQLLISHPDEIIASSNNLESIETNLPLEQDLLNNSDNKPKKIIGDLMVRILEILPSKLEKDNLLALVNLVEKNLGEKQILLYFTDEQLQAELSKFSLAGEIKNAKHDYLAVVNTNIAGQKTDRKMTEKIEHFSRVNDNGKIINTVKITRTHSGIKNEVFTGVRNVNWLRIYVPEGSRLLAASGANLPDKKYFDYPEEDWLDLEVLAEERLAVYDQNNNFKIYREKNKTVFATWTMTDPGERSEVVVTYELPFNFFDFIKEQTWQEKLSQILDSDQANYLQYSLLVQKQAGAKNSTFISNLELPQAYKLLREYPEKIIKQNKWSLQDELNTDKYYTIFLEI